MIKRIALLSLLITTMPLTALASSIAFYDSSPKSLELQRKIDELNRQKISTATNDDIKIQDQLHNFPTFPAGLFMSSIQLAANANRGCMNGDISACQQMALTAKMLKEASNEIAILSIRSCGIANPNADKKSCDEFLRSVTDKNLIDPSKTADYQDLNNYNKETCEDFQSKYGSQASTSQSCIFSKKYNLL